MHGRVVDVLCIVVVVDDLVDCFLLFSKIRTCFILLFFFIVNAKKLDGFVAPRFSVLFSKFTFLRSA